mgnify:CR=1 FL=1
MNLIFKADKQISGGLCKGYLVNWNFSRNNGSYSKGKDFLSIHWEIGQSSADIVRFHVESPIDSVDNELNFIKNKIITLILAKLKDIKNCIKIGELKTGLRLSNTNSNKSTEVFKVILYPNNVFSTHEENIKQVHNQVEGIINDVVMKFTLDIEKIGLESNMN